MKDDEEEDEDKKPTELTSKQLSEIIQNFQYACDFTRENDPIDDSIVIKNVINDIKCYTEEAKKNSRIEIDKLNSTIFSLLNNENFITVLELLFVTLCNDAGIKS